VTYTEEAWDVHHESVMFDARVTRDQTESDGGRDEWNNFEFGFPAAIRLQDGTYLATHWSREAGKFGIRWTRLRVEF
jgi:hypothetical protein